MSPQTSGGEPGRPDGPSIAIIGTEGSGKTVLATALARHLGRADTRGVFLNPLGVGTMRYVERVWQTLQGESGRRPRPRAISSSSGGSSG